MNKAEHLKAAEEYLAQAELNKYSDAAVVNRELAKVHIMLANSTESINVLTDKELAQAKKNVAIVEACGKMASEMLAFDGEIRTMGRILYDKVYYS